MNSTSRGFEIGQQRRQIAGLGDHRAGGGAEIDAQFARHDLRQRRLAEARRSDKQHMVERLLARARCFDEHAQVGARLFLADEFGQALRAQDAYRTSSSRRSAAIRRRGLFISPAPAALPDQRRRVGALVADCARRRRWPRPPAAGRSRD